MSFQVFAAIAAAGSVGAVLRFLLVQLLQSWPGAPWATAAVNVAGCLGFGLCWALAQDRWSPLLTTAVLVGFFGAFTTFSSFAFDCQQLLAERRYAALLGNLAVQNLLGLAALLGGIGLADWLRD
ncbi:MAG: fluoride efflux transporter FluC [Planctomycetota bacterium]|jgi:CrcB protein